MTDRGKSYEGSRPTGSRPAGQAPAGSTPTGGKKAAPDGQSRVALVIGNGA